MEQKKHLCIGGNVVTMYMRCTLFQSNSHEPMIFFICSYYQCVCRFNEIGDKFIQLPIKELKHDLLKLKNKKVQSESLNNTLRKALSFYEKMEVQISTHIKNLKYFLDNNLRYNIITQKQIELLNILQGKNNISMIKDPIPFIYQQKRNNKKQIDFIQNNLKRLQTSMQQSFYECLKNIQLVCSDKILDLIQQQNKNIQKQNKLIQLFKTHPETIKHNLPSLQPQSLTNLTHLQITQQIIDKIIMQNISNVCSNIKSLTLIDSKPSNDILKVLKFIPNLQQLNLSLDKMQTPLLSQTPEVYLYLMDILHNKKLLNKLTLHFNQDLNSSSTYYIYILHLLQPHLEKIVLYFNTTQHCSGIIDFSDNKLSFKNLKELVLFNHNKNKQQLNRNKIDSFVTNILFNSLSINSLTLINLGLQIGLGSTKTLFPRNSQIKYLNLQNNIMKENGLMIISQRLLGLQTLYVNKCQIQNEYVQNICFRQLKHLQIADNFLTTTSVLITFCNSHTQLIQLNIMGQKMNVLFFKDKLILNIIENMKKLKILKLNVKPSNGGLYYLSKLNKTQIQIQIKKIGVDLIVGINKIHKNCRRIKYYQKSNLIKRGQMFTKLYKNQRIYQSDKI